MKRSAFDDVCACLQLYSRLPVRSSGTFEMPNLADVGWAIPLAGAIIGTVGAVALLLARLAQLSPEASAIFVIAVLALATGAMHEDGLADTVDGFGGGATRERKLAIMRDSRLGTYGALALCLSILARVSFLAVIIERATSLAALSLVAVAAVSRVAGLVPMRLLPAARLDGAGAAAGSSRPISLVAFLIGTGLGLCPGFIGASFAQTFVAVTVAFTAALLVTELARRQIGGYTGDVLGAAQQAAEIAALAALSAS